MSGEKEKSGHTRFLEMLVLILAAIAVMVMLERYAGDTPGCPPIDCPPAQHQGDAQ